MKNTGVPESSIEKALLSFISTMELVGVLSSFVSSSVLCNCRKTQTRSLTQPRVNFHMHLKFNVNYASQTKQTTLEMTFVDLSLSLR